MSSSITVSDRTIELNYDGHLVSMEDWSEEVAEALAVQDGITLTEDHWKVLNFEREYYNEYGYTPEYRQLLKEGAKRLGPELGNSARLYNLFPLGPSKQAARYAGLPMSEHDSLDH